jgi:ribosomal protein L21E
MLNQTGAVAGTWAKAYELKLNSPQKLQKYIVQKSHH